MSWATSGVYNTLLHRLTLHHHLRLTSSIHPVLAAAVVILYEDTDGVNCTLIAYTIILSQFLITAIEAGPLSAQVHTHLLNLY